MAESPNTSLLKRRPPPRIVVRKRNPLVPRSKSLEAAGAMRGRALISNGLWLSWRVAQRTQEGLRKDSRWGLWRYVGGMTAVALWVTRTSEAYTVI
jgi:hypothetical protein